MPRVHVFASLAALWTATGMNFAQPTDKPQATPEAEPDKSPVPPDLSLRRTPWRFGVIWENDSSFHTFVDAGDSDYTEGLRIDFAWQPEFARRWADALPLASEFKDARAAVGVAIGQNFYTPDDLTDPNPIPDDHPYGGWLYSGFYLHRADATRLDQLELDIGVTNEWSGDEPTQKFIHRMVDSPNPQGWDNQGQAEPGANIVLGRTWKFGAGPQERWRGEILPYVGATVGTVNVNASGGATFRVGYNMPEDFGLSRIGRMGDQTAAPGRGLGGYLFGRLGGRAVAYDAFLDGSLFNNDDPSVGHEPLVGEAQVGVAVRLTTWLDLNYSQTWWTEEYEAEGHGQHLAAYGFNIHGVF